MSALRSAFNLISDEFDRIIADLGFDANTVLSVENISAVYRRGWVARKLALSVREFLLLIRLTGLDPFAPPDPAGPAIMKVIALVKSLKERSLKSTAALYSIWNQDLSGKSAPDPAQVRELARTLRGDFVAIEDQFAVTDDPSGEVARTRMALVYGTEATDMFFSLLEDTIELDTPYTNPQPALKPAITNADSRIGYDDFRHLLLCAGVLTPARRHTLKNLPALPAGFKAAVDALFDRSQDVKGSFFARYPELEPLYNAFIASPDPIEKKRKALLAGFRPELSRRRKQQQALQRLSAAAGVDLPFTQVIMNADAPPHPLHAVGHPNRPALNDVLGVERPGLAVQFFFHFNATGPVDLEIPRSGDLEYSPGGKNELPENPNPGHPISGIWRGLIEAPETGFFNFVVDADRTANVTLNLGGIARGKIQAGGLCIQCHIRN